MTRTVTYLASPNTRPGTNAESLTVGPLAVSANSLFILSCYCLNAGNEALLDWHIVSNTEGLTFTRQVQPAYIDVAFGGFYALFTAPVTDAAADLEVVVETHTPVQNARYALQVAEVVDDGDGTVTVVQAAGNGQASAEPFVVGTLGAAATSGNTTLLFVGRGTSATEAMSTPTNFTLLHADNATTMDQTSFESTTFTGTTASITNVGDSLFGSQMGALLELTSEDAPIGDPAVIITLSKTI